MTEFLEGLDPVNVIPDYVQNFAEASMYVMESVDSDFFEVLESAGFVNESGVIDESTEVVTEGVKELANKFIEALKTLWTKIQAWFGNVVKWFEEQKDKFRKHLQDLVKKASDATVGKIDGSLLSKLKADKKVGSYTKYNIDVASIKATYNAVIKASDAVITDSADIDANLAAEKDKLAEALGGANAKEIAAHVKSTMVTSTKKDATVADIKADFAEIKAVVFGNNDKKALTMAYTSAKKAIDESIKNINKAKAKGFKKSEEEKSQNAILAKQAIFNKSANQALHAYHSAVVGLMRARFAQYAHIVYVCVQSAIGATVKDAAKNAAEKAKEAEKKAAEKVKEKLPKKKEAATESVTLESLFEW